MKVLCPAHKDTIPSLHLYPEFAHCFSCGYHCKITEVPNAPKEIKREEPEDVQAMVSKIIQRPIRTIRGLKLHAGVEGFYILWPDHSYYKLRHSGRGRYQGPRGIRPNLLLLGPEPNRCLVLIEGELNALSLAEAYPERSFSIASPGSASDLQRHIEDYKRYEMVVVVVDRDPAGIANGCVLKETLTKLGKSVMLICVPVDFNDLLQRGGPALVRETFEKELR